MSMVKKIENEYKRAIKSCPENASLYNDYAVFLCKYKNNRELALKYMSKALMFNPSNKTFKSNYLKLRKRVNSQKTSRKHNVFAICVVVLMVWLGYNGYSNFMNMLSLFIVAQIVLDSRKTFCVQEDKIFAQD